MQAGAATAALAGSPAVGAPAAAPPGEGPGTPKICLEMGPGALAAGTLDAAGMRRVKQLGVDYVLMGGPRIPWEESAIRATMAQLKEGGLTLGNMMIGGFPNVIYGRPGRDEEIEKVQQSIRAAGRAGLPVIEYNFYAHRIVEGYFEETGRAGAGLTAFDYERVKNLEALPNEGVHSIDEMWANVTYFLKAVVPVAQQAGVRLALHPNDPPAPLSRGSGQIMGTVEGWKKLVSIVRSPSNGITFDCGVTREMGHDPVEVCRYFGKLDCINHVHYRNVRVRKPYENYTEVFIDEGVNNMFAIMKELVRQKYPRLVYPEHPRALDIDRERPGFKPAYPGGGSYTGFAYNVGYARAMMQAATKLGEIANTKWSMLGKMANADYLATLCSDVDEWNGWRSDDPGLRPDLAGADLRGASLVFADLRHSILRKADLRMADLKGADLRWADLREANFIGARLIGADLSGADLRGADLRTAEDLTTEQLQEAIGDERTLLPEETPRPLRWASAHGAR